MAVPLSIRNLLESRARFLISVGGIALAALLILVLDGVFEGTQRQVTAYMDNEDFDVVVSQSGVRNLHMTTSSMSATRLAEVRRVPGVAEVASILYSTVFLVGPEGRGNAYLIGYETGKPGGPWVRVSGRLPPGRDEVVIDERVAERLGVGLGDTVRITGHEVEVAALTRGTVNVVNSIAFVNAAEFERLFQARGIISYVLVRAESGESPAALAGRIRRDVKGVTVQTRTQFSESERRIVGDMSVDIMKVMNFFGLLVGLAVVGLTVYASTLSKLHEYGVLKALGARNRRLFLVVFQQAAVSVAVGLILALLVALAIQAALTVVDTGFQIAVSALSVARIAVTAAVIGLIASAAPIARIAGLDPAAVFRR